MFKQLILFSILSTSLALPEFRQDGIRNPWLPGSSTGRYLKGKSGLGTCPSISDTPNEQININGILGTWYVHYHHEPTGTGLKCYKWVISRTDGETEGIPCQLKIHLSGVDVATGELKTFPSDTLFLDDDDNQLQVIKKKPGLPPVSWYLNNEFSNHLLVHGCEEFPGDDFPIKAYYQHNYIVSRARDEITPDTTKALRALFNEVGIDFDTFIKMDQQSCEEEIIVEPEPFE